MKIVEFAKDHPYMVGGGVLVGGVVILLILSGGSGEETEQVVAPSLGGYAPGMSEAALAANAATVQTQYAAQIAAKQSDNALKKVESDNATALGIASKQFDLQNNANVLAQQLGMAGINAQVETVKINTSAQTMQLQIQAGVANTANENALKAVLSSYDRDKAIAQMAANTALQMSTNEKDVALASITNSRDVALANITNTSPLQINRDNIANEQWKILNTPKAPVVQTPAPPTQKYSAQQIMSNVNLAKSIGALAPSGSVAQGGTFSGPDINRAVAYYASNWQSLDAKL